MKLGISPLLPTANFLNKRYSIEMDFPDESNPADNFKYLNEVILAVHMAECPQFYINGKPTYLPQVADYKGEEPIAEVQVDKAPNPVQAAIDDIKKCETMDDLKSFWTLSKSNLNISLAYKEKEKQLKDAEK